MQNIIYFILKFLILRALLHGVISSFSPSLFPVTEGLLSYSIPKGVIRGMEVDLSDRTYDGEEEGDRLVGGLGQLVDGQKGADNFRIDIHGFGKGEYSDYHE